RSRQASHNGYEVVLAHRYDANNSAHLHIRKTLLECQLSLGPDDWTPVAHADRAGGCRVWSRNRLRGNSWPRSVGAAMSHAGAVMVRADGTVVCSTDWGVMARADRKAGRAA